MTLLEIIRKKKIATATVATLATDKPVLVPSVATVASVAVAKPTNEKINRDIERIESWLFHIGEPEEDHCLMLNKCKNDPEALAYYLERIKESKREERRAKVLAILADSPETQRAIITDLDGDPDNVILTIAIHDQYSFEMAIPKHRYDPFILLELIKKGSVQ